jgi:hypothetical protein
VTARKVCARHCGGARNPWPASADIILGPAPMTADQSHRFALTGQDPEGRNRTIILWREVDLIDRKVVRQVVLTLDATMTTATVLTPPAGPPTQIPDRPLVE